jgi:hypothetical protein
MGRMAIVAYRPRAGKEALLLQLTKEHLPVLREQGLATDRPPLAMRAADGTIIEVFEWKSPEAIAQAHSNPVVSKLWQRYWDACECVPLANVQECSAMFASFEPIEL